MTKAKSKSKPKTPAKSPEKESVLDARGHKPNSQEGKVHTCFVEQDEARPRSLWGND